MAAITSRPAPEALPVAVAVCLQRHTQPGQSLCVALSGGVDSVVLLHALRQVAGDRSLSALHVDHGLQTSSGQWAAFCQRLCAEWQIPLTIEQVAVDSKSPYGLEAAARNARHAVFARQKTDWIALGHQRGDRAETLLLNLLRGTGVRGAAALPERRGRLLRPLIELPRTSIEDYARAHALTWVEDGSNAATDFRRNFLRHEILPRLAGRIPAAEAQLAAAAARFHEAQGLLDALAELDLAGRSASFPFEVDVLRQLDEARAGNLLRYLLARHGVGVSSERRFVEALRQFRQAAPDRHPEVHFGHFCLQLSRGRLWLSAG